MIYVCIGLYAEGPTDYWFLRGLLDQIAFPMACDVLGRAPEMLDCLGIDAPPAFRKKRREERIAAAIDEYWDHCTLFVIHADGAGAPDEARRTRVQPGLARASFTHPDLIATACVPVRETEAWMLAEPAAFTRVFGVKNVPALPADPEGVLDPKRLLRETIDTLGLSTERSSSEYYASFGRELDPAVLRRLPAFRRFEADLRTAIEALAGGSPA